MSKSIRLADALCLAASPTFACLALLTGFHGGGAMDLLCAGASPLNGMTAMYALMSGFHPAPWLRLAARRRPL